MNHDIHITLPWPPSGNHLYGINMRTGRRFRTKAYKMFLDRVHILLLQRRITPFPGRVGVILDAYPPTNRRRDEDNLQKPVFDALKQNDRAFGLFRDDHLAHIEAVNIHPKDPKNPRIEVRARPIPETEQ